MSAFIQVLSCVALAALLCSSVVSAEGIYESVPLRGKEPHDLMETSAEFNRMFVRRSLLYTNETVNEFVRRIGNDLAPSPTDDYINYQFFVIRDPSPNAFAFPNGHIYVHTGMLARLEDESQLAALLAHEINHVAGHHSILQFRITAKKLAIDIFTAGIGSIFTQLAYSRELEQEADDRAALMLYDSPYDPHAIPELFALIAADFEGLSPRVATIWTTHPDPELRVVTSLGRVTNMPKRDRDPAIFDAAVFPLRATTIEDYIQDDYPYTAIALAQDLLERYPGISNFRCCSATPGGNWGHDRKSPPQNSPIRKSAVICGHACAALGRSELLKCSRPRKGGWHLRQISNMRAQRISRSSMRIHRLHLPTAASGKCTRCCGNRATRRDLISNTCGLTRMRQIKL